MTDRNQEDLRYMQMALDMAKLWRGYTNPNPMVGAVIVKEGKVIAKGYHHCCGQGHAEVEAFKDAGDQDVTGATIYVTLEPCSHYGKTPPCADKIIEKKIGALLGIRTDYNGLGKVQYLLGQRGLTITGSEYTDIVTVETLVPQAQLQELKEAITEGTNGRAEFIKEEAVCFAFVDGEPLIF